MNIIRIVSGYSEITAKTLKIPFWSKFFIGDYVKERHGFAFHANPLSCDGVCVYVTKKRVEIALKDK